MFRNFFLITEETGTDVTGSQTGCCDYNTMKMPGRAMKTQKAKEQRPQHVSATAIKSEKRVCGCFRCEYDDDIYQADTGNADD